MVRSMDANSEYDGYGRTIACIGCSAYNFDGLNLGQTMSVGWYLARLLTVDALKWSDTTGWLKIAAERTASRLSTSRIPEAEELHGHLAAMLRQNRH